MSEVHVCAGWESSAPYRCRWFVAWSGLDRDDLVYGASEMIAGVYAGYSGGGTFEVEEFRAETADCEVYTFWSDEKDLVSGEEIDCDPSAWKGVDAACKAAWTVFRQWMDDEEWSESHAVWLREMKLGELTASDEGDLVCYNSRDFRWDEIETIRELFSFTGLTAGPVWKETS